LQQSSTQEAQSFRWIPSDTIGNKDDSKEVGWWEGRRPRYTGLGFPRSLDVWDARCDGLPKSKWPITRTDFIADMEFVASLTAVENVGRVMELLRAARLGEWSTAAVVAAVVSAETAVGSEGDNNCWTALLASGLRLGQELGLIGTRQHLLVTRAAEQLPRNKANGLGG